MFKSIELSFRDLLAIMVVLLCFAFLGLLVSGFVPPETLREMAELKIAMITTIGVVIGYYFGSSHSSKNRDETINQALKKGLESKALDPGDHEGNKA